MKSFLTVFLFLCVFMVGHFQLFAEEPEAGLEDLMAISEASMVRQEEIKAVQKGIRDPFKPLLPPPKTVEIEEKSPGEPVDVQLYGIGYGSEGAYAILNEDVYYEGEEIEGIKLMKVRKNEVEIKTGGTTKTLSMLSEDELKRLENRRDRKEKARQSIIA